MFGRARLAQMFAPGANSNGGQRNAHGSYFRIFYFSVSFRFYFSADFVRRSAKTIYLAPMPHNACTIQYSPVRFVVSHIFGYAVHTHVPQIHSFAKKYIFFCSSLHIYSAVNRIQCQLYASRLYCLSMPMPLIVRGQDATRRKQK